MSGNFKRYGAIKRWSKENPERSEAALARWRLENPEKAADWDRRHGIEPELAPPEAPPAPDNLDELIGLTLRHYAKVSQWSTKDLADAVAMRPEIDLSSTKMPPLMLALAAKPGSIASRCYDPATKRWRYRD